MKLRTLHESASQYAQAIYDYLKENGIDHATMDLQNRDLITIAHPDRPSTMQPHIRIFVRANGEMDVGYFQPRTDDQGYTTFGTSRPPMKFLTAYDPKSFPKILAFIKKYPEVL